MLMMQREILGTSLSFFLNYALEGLYLFIPLSSVVSSTLPMHTFV